MLGNGELGTYSVGVVLEEGSADELPQERSRRDDVRLDELEQVEDVEEVVRQVILRVA